MTHRNLASIYALRAEFESASGRPRESLERALSHIEQATRANLTTPRRPPACPNPVVLATDRRQQGQDAHAAGRKFRPSSWGFIEVSPNQPDSYLVELRILILSAHGVRRQQRPLAQAHAAAHRARALSAQSPAVYVGLGALALPHCGSGSLRSQRPADRETARDWWHSIAPLPR